MEETAGRTDGAQSEFVGREIRHTASEGGVLCKHCRVALLPIGDKRYRKKRYRSGEIVVMWGPDPRASWATTDRSPSHFRPFRPFCHEMDKA